MSLAAHTEAALTFSCEGSQLWGVLTRPAPAIPDATIAVVIAVGGPQYRVGSHRQFVLLARRLAEQGFTSLRFDCRGMGDSEGTMRDFESSGPDLHRAIDALREACPTAQGVVVWGLCDAASAAMMFAVAHQDVVGLVALNPWARSDASLAAAKVKHYYGARLLDREFWAKLLRGGVDWRGSIGALLSNLKQARALGRVATSGRPDESFQTLMAKGLAGFRGRMLLIIATNDLTAKEFLEYANVSASWRGLLSSPSVDRIDVPDADHTFSCRAWRGQVEEATIVWLRGLERTASR